MTNTFKFSKKQLHQLLHCVLGVTSANTLKEKAPNTLARKSLN